MVEPVLDLFAAHDETSVAGWIAGSGQSATNGVHEITLRSSDPDDLTLREARMLGSADVVVHDLAVPESILVRARADAVRRPLGEIEPEGLVVVLKFA